MSATDEIVNFLEHCILVASGSPLASDGEEIQKALRLVAEAFCPDLVSGAETTFNVESGEIVVETENAFYYVAARAVAR